MTLLSGEEDLENRLRHMQVRPHEGMCRLRSLHASSSHILVELWSQANLEVESSSKPKAGVVLQRCMETNVHHLLKLQCRCVFSLYDLYAHGPSPTSPLASPPWDTPAGSVD